MNNRYWLASTLLMVLATCKGAPPKAPAAPRIENRADGPRGQVDEDAVSRELDARMAALHHTDIVELDMAVHSRADGTSVAFYLYAYSAFDAWQGEKKAAGEFDRIEAAAEAAERACRDERAREEAEIDRRVEELEAIAEKTGATEDVEAWEHAMGEQESLAMTPIECNGWNDYYEGDAARAGLCGNDRIVLAAYAIRPGPAESGMDIEEIGRQSEEGCQVDQTAYGESSIVSGDLARDGSVEAIWLRMENELYDVGRGESQVGTSGVQVTIYNERLVEKDSFGTAFPMMDSEVERSVIARAWLGDRNGDGHPDIVREQMEFDSLCACADPAFQALVDSEPAGFDASWKELEKVAVCTSEKWRMTMDGDKLAPCPATGTTSEERLYDQDAGAWK